MIEQYNYTCDLMPPNDQKICTPILTDTHCLTLEKHSVLLFRCSKEYYLEDLNTIQQQMQKVFPNNKVVVLFEDIVPEVIHDKSYKIERPLAEDYDGYYT